MNVNNPFIGRRFFGRFSSVCAVCTALAVPALSANLHAAPVKGAPGTSPEKTEKDVKVSDYGTVTLAVQDSDLADVLQMLGMQSQKNMIISKNVSASVTAYLYDVTLPEALKAILAPNGYGFKEEGNFIYIYTLEEMALIDEQSRKLESRMFVLDYLSAVDAKDFITPLLSDNGKAAARGDVQPGFKPDPSDGGADNYAFDAKLVVSDYVDNLDAIAKLLNELDVRPRQVLVESTILQANVDESDAFGIDFSVIGNVNFTDLTAPLAAVSNLLNGNDATGGFQPADNKAHAVSTSVGNTDGPGGIKVGIVSDDISVFLRVLDEVTDSTVIAKPKVMALNRQRAQVLVGARVGYLSTTATETTTTQSVKFLDTGVKLVFRPFISEDGSIRLELSPSVSEASLRTVTDSNGALVTIPDELTNELQTNVRIRSGQTLVLGGLYRESITTAKRQVPVLGDIPILGYAFKGHDNTVDRDEIIFLITPTIVEDDILWTKGTEAHDYVETVRVGMRGGLLEFSREKMVSQHNQDAIAAHQTGDNDKALYHVNKSLYLNPSQAEMIKFRDTLNGTGPSRVHEKSILERIFRSQSGGPMTSGFFGGNTDHLGAIFETDRDKVSTTPVPGESGDDGTMVPAEDSVQQTFVDDPSASAESFNDGEMTAVIEVMNEDSVPASTFSSPSDSSNEFVTAVFTAAGVPNDNCDVPAATQSPLIFKSSPSTTIARSDSITTFDQIMQRLFAQFRFTPFQSPEPGSTQFPEALTSATEPADSSSSVVTADPETESPQK